MAFLFRRIILSLLIPFLWRTWRDRRRARRATPARANPAPAAGPDGVPAAS